MKIGIAQINTKVGNLQGNYNKITDYISESKKRECDIVVFPELSISGYPPEDLLLNKTFVLHQLQYVKKLIKETTDITVVLGYAQPSDFSNASPFNACTVFYNAKELTRHYKSHLPNYSVFDEKRYFNQENFEFNSYFEYKGQKISVNICEDLWVDYGISYDQYEKAKPDIMINISCSPFYSGKLKERKKLLIKRAKEYNTNIVYCNLVGGQDELVFDGGSMVIGKDGRVLGKAPQFRENLMVYDVDNKEHSYIPSVLPIYSKEGEIWNALKLGLGDYIRKNGFKKVVLGMSGGIDSALVAKLAVDTLGKENVVCVSMPSKYSSEGTQNDARDYSKQLGVEFHEIPIKNCFNIFLDTLNPLFKGTKEDISEENLQARIRGNVILALSNKFGYLPLSCSNKSETAVGYFTYAGDSVGGFSPIKDLYKTEVIKIAKYVGVLESIINRPPSAELKKDQKDEDSLPPYEILDKILKKFIENKQSPETDLEKRIYKLILRSEWKRRYSPIGIKIQNDGWGKDWRFPITNGYKNDKTNIY